MHASLAFVNGAGSADKDLRLLNALLSTASKQPGSGKGKALDRGKTKDERQAEEESKADTVSKPGSAAR